MTKQEQACACGDCFHPKFDDAGAMGWWCLDCGCAPSEHRVTPPGKSGGSE